MKKAIKLSFALLALMGVLFTSCKKDYPTPPIQSLPIGEVYTIGDLLAMESGTVFNEDASVYGIITADEKSGNLYKAAFMQDRATGDAIELYLDATSGVRIGDSVRIYLKDVTYALYNGLPQLSGFEADGHIVILANDKPIPPEETTIADIVAGHHLGGLVKLNNVMFTDKGTFAEPSTYGNRTLVDPTNLTQSVIVRTSNYANFANDSLPQGVGNLVAIATVYNTTWQLLIRSAKELEFDGYEPGGDGGVITLPYYQSFASNFGTYTTFDALGAQSWMIDYSTAKMAGYENSVNYANEDWLISSQFSLEDVSSASLTMTYIARYFNNLNEDITIQVSEDYQEGDPNDAQWTWVPASWTSGNNWTDFAQTTVDLSDFVGKKVRVAVKYLSTDAKAGTIEVQSIAIQEGAGPTPPPGPGPSGEVQNLPYVQSFTSEFGTYLTKDISGAQSWMIDFSTAKMTGYDNSVNYENEDWLISSPVALTGVNEAKMTIIYIARYFNNLNEDITFWVSSGYTYGDDPYSAQWTQVPATLVSGSNWTSFATTEIGLNDFVGETVTIAVKYLSTSVKAGTIEIQSIAIEEGSGPTPPPGPGTGEGTGTQDDPYNVASGISLQNQDVVAWVRGYIVGCVKPDLSLVASNDDISWEGPYRLATNVLIADAPDVKDISRCVFVNLPSGKPLRTEVNLVDHPENIGKVLTVKGKLRTYFQQAGLRDSGGTQNDFILEGYVPPTPPEPEGIFSESFFNGQGSFTIQDVVMPDDLTYIWAHNSTYQCMKASAYKDYAHEAESWLISPAIEIPLMNIITLTFEQAVNYASPEGRLSIMVTTDFTGDVTQTEWTEVQLDSWPTGDNWDFITSSGNLSDYMGQTIVFAFKYTSNENVSATWEVKNIVINY